MSTFVAKLRAVTLGTVHDLLDKAIDMNSPSVLRQYVRDLEDAQDKLSTLAAEQAGGVRTYVREISELDAKIDVGKKTITKLLATGHPDLAKIKGSEVLALQDQRKDKAAALDAQRTTSQRLDEAVSKLNGKHATMVVQLRQLESLDRDTKAKEQAGRTLQMAGRLVSGGADVSVDDISSKMRARNDVASEKFSRAMGDVTVPENPEENAAVDDLLKELAPQEQKAAASN